LVDVIAWTRRSFVGHRSAHALAPDHPLQTHTAHQPFDSAAGNLKALAFELPPDLACAVDAEVLIEHPLDLCSKLCIALGAWRCRLRMRTAMHTEAIGRWGNRQYTADWLDPIRRPVLVDEGHHVLDRRSSSAWAK
jgi:hypothetical protein